MSETEAALERTGSTLPQLHHAVCVGEYGELGDQNLGRFAQRR